MAWGAHMYPGAIPGAGAGVHPGLVPGTHPGIPPSAYGIPAPSTLPMSSQLSAEFQTVMHYLLQHPWSATEVSLLRQEVNRLIPRR